MVNYEILKLLGLKFNSSMFSWTNKIIVGTLKKKKKRSTNFFPLSGFLCVEIMHSSSVLAYEKIKIKLPNYAYKLEEMLL